MPMYEYQCQACKKEFELLHLAGRETKNVCPDCGSVKIQQRVSVFSAHSAGTAGGGMETPEKCGSCPSAGSCGMGGF